jgi:hypothetical protein
MGTSKNQKQVDDKLGKYIAVTVLHFHVCAVYGVFEAVMVETGEEGGRSPVATPIVDFHPAKLEKALDLARSSCSTWSGLLFSRLLVPASKAAAAFINFTPVLLKVPQPRREKATLNGPALGLLAFG